MALKIAIEWRLAIAAIALSYAAFVLNVWDSASNSTFRLPDMFQTPRFVVYAVFVPSAGRRDWGAAACTPWPAAAWAARAFAAHRDTIMRAQSGFFQRYGLALFGGYLLLLWVRHTPVPQKVPGLLATATGYAEATAPFGPVA